MAHGPPFGLDEVLVSSRVIVAASLTLLAMLVGCGQDEARVSAALDPQLTSSQPGDEIAASADSAPQSPPTPPNDPPRSEPPTLTTEQAEPPQRLLVFVDGGPLCVDLRLMVNGRDPTQQLQPAIDHVMAAADQNEDGEATWGELLDNEEFLAGPLVTESQSQNREYLARQWRERFDENRDQRLSTKEAARWLRRNQSTTQPVKLITTRTAGHFQIWRSAAWQLLDVNQDNILSAAEALAARRRLWTRDENEDHVLEAHEFASIQSQMRAAGGFMPLRRRTQRHAALLLSPDGPWSRVSYTLTDTYAPRGSLQRDSFPLLPNLFAELDADGDQFLSQANLVALHSRPAEINMDVDFGGDDSGDKQTSRLSCQLRADGVTGGMDVKYQGPTRTVLAVGDQAIVVSVHDILATSDATDAASDQFDVLDGDENGYLTPDEFEEEGVYDRDRFDSIDADANKMVTLDEVVAYLELRQMVEATQLELHVHDQGDALFHALDADYDGRLSEREVTTAQRRLAALDANADGELDGEEVPTQLTMLIIRGALDVNGAASGGPPTPPPPPSRFAPDWFIKGDFNRDGDISAGEFLGTPEQFAELDANQDTFISPAEARQLSE